MRFYIVFTTTLIALFWDECMIGLFSFLFKKPINMKFMMIWIIMSGVLASIFVSCHIPEEYRSVTLILIGIAILFSLNEHQQKISHDKDESK
jgi:uncharacterized membrane protein YfcA